MKISLRKKTLLVVDDNAPVQKTLRRLGESVGYDVTPVASREEAFDEIGRCRFDVALVDMRLVEGDKQNHDGIAIIKHLHSQGEGSRGYLMTGYGEIGDAIKAAASGAVASIEKKSDPAATELAIREALEAEMKRATEHRRMRSPQAFCGNENASDWESLATYLLRPTEGTHTLLRLLDELVGACDPLVERPEDNGMQNVTPSALAGLFWSRGLGHAVVVVVTSSDIPVPIPPLATWPEELTIATKSLCSHSKHNLTGAIFPAGGVSPSLFSIRRNYWE